MATTETDESALPPAAPPGFTDHTFRSSSGTELAVRVWPADPPVSGPAPFVIWWVRRFDSGQGGFRSRGC